MQSMTDDQIRGSDGVRNIMQFIDDYAPYPKISDHEDFERAAHGHERL